MNYDSKFLKDRLYTLLFSCVTCYLVDKVQQTVWFTVDTSFPLKMMETVSQGFILYKNSFSCPIRPCTIFVSTPWFPEIHLPYGLELVAQSRQACAQSLLCICIFPEKFSWCPTSLVIHKVI